MKKLSYQNIAPTEIVGVLKCLKMDMICKCIETQNSEVFILINIKIIDDVVSSNEKLKI